MNYSLLSLISCYLSLHLVGDQVVNHLTKSNAIYYYYQHVTVTTFDAAVVVAMNFTTVIAVIHATFIRIIAFDQNYYAIDPSTYLKKILAMVNFYCFSCHSHSLLSSMEATTLTVIARFNQNLKQYCCCSCCYCCFSDCY